MQGPIYSTPNHTFSTHDLPYESFAREVYSHNGDFIAKVYGRTIEECESNAKAIKDRCNAFHALVEALTTLLRDEKLDDDSIVLITTRSKCETLLHSLKSEG